MIEAKRITEANRIVKLFSEDADLKILNGRWGPYIAYGKDNYKIPKGTSTDDLNFDAVMQIINADKRTATAANKKTTTEKTAVKKTATKKVAAKKSAAKKSTSKKATPKKSAKK